jgi:hypothetical protein
MVSIAPIVAVIVMQQHQEEMRRRQEEERRRRQREEEERRRREEEERQMIEHRKNSPVVFTHEGWQIDRCLKAFSLQASVQRLVSLVDEVVPMVIEREDNKYNDKLLDLGTEYELVKTSLNNDIDELRKLGITVSGNQIKYMRVAESKISKPEKEIEGFGKTFTVANSQPIELDPDIMSKEGYFEDRYKKMNPQELEKEYHKISSKMNRFTKAGKVLGFLLKTDKYLDLKEENDAITSRHDECITKKKEMESFDSLNKEQLLAIKSYFVTLSKLRKVSANIEYLFQEKDTLKDKDNGYAFNLSLGEVIENSDNRDLIRQVHEYIEKICYNDEETMKEAYELVKGEYPIKIQRRCNYEHMMNVLKEDCLNRVKKVGRGY